MTVQNVHDDIQAGLRDSADAIDITGLLPLAQIAPRARKRARRRVVGGLATVLIAVAVTMGLGVALKDETPSAVFAGQTNIGLTPGVVTADGDRFVGLAVIDPFEFDDLGDVRMALVTSSDGDRWDPVPDAPVIVALGARLAVWNDVFHIVGTRGVEATRLDATTSIERDLVHMTSVDLVTWTETFHPLSVDVDLDEFHTGTTHIAFTEQGPVVLLTHTASRHGLDEMIEELGYDQSDLCDFKGESNRVTVRACGETEAIRLPGPGHSFPFEYNLVTLFDGVIRYVDLPVVDDGRTRLPSPTALYQTDIGVGVTARDVFESTDGLEWTIIDVGREPAVLMAARGPERVFKTSRDVERYGPDDPVKGMGYSADSGATWRDVPTGNLFDADLDAWSRSFGSLTAGPGGWMVVAQSNLEERPEVVGVTRDGDTERFTVTVDEYVLEGRTPFGPAELRDPSGTVVRSWAQLELSNPLWSGLDVVQGDIVIDEATGSGSITVTAEQWSALVDTPGPNQSELMFSPDGVNWSIIDSSPMWTQVLATTTEGALVQRWQIGNFSYVVPPVELIPFPVAESE